MAKWELLEWRKQKLISAQAMIPAVFVKSLEAILYTIKQVAVPNKTAMTRHIIKYGAGLMM
jgi:hypothetical protein